MFCRLVVLVRLSVPVQVTDWKDSSPKWPVMCWGDVKPYSLTHSKISSFMWPNLSTGTVLCCGAVHLNVCLSVCLSVWPVWAHKPREKRKRYVWWRYFSWHVELRLRIRQIASSDCKVWESEPQCRRIKFWILTGSQFDSTVLSSVLTALSVRLGWKGYYNVIPQNHNSHNKQKLWWDIRFHILETCSQGRIRAQAS